ncbi:response regulator transcription factor [Sphaerisporangium corydalis]|uniref:response regulator transcription factor n=1 Tax=Sphaerisporangium corydalis TaxID=1441875 RepID=UPI0021D2DFA6|nr:response regulator transcription factor [Sphaerisporangium corydalis]
MLLVGLSPLTSLGIETVLSRSFGVQNVEHRETALERAAKGDVDLVILDPYGPTLSDGLKFCQRLKELRLPPQVLAFSEFGATRDLTYFYLAGIDSFISSREGPERLAAAVRSTLEGKREWILGTPDRRETRDRELDGLSDLTPRELEVLWMVSDRYTNGQIARSLSISPNTVKNHVAAILRKLGAKRRTELFSGAPHRV